MTFVERLLIRLRLQGPLLRQKKAEKFVARIDFPA
jgi:hypothetical protein